jgi:hypothetical protein
MLDDKVVIPKSVKINNKNGNPRYKKEYMEVNAQEYARNLINRERRQGWDLTI